MTFNLNHSGTVTLTKLGAEILNRNPDRERDYAAGDRYTDRFISICHTFRSALGLPLCEPFLMTVELDECGCEPAKTL